MNYSGYMLMSTEPYNNAYTTFFSTQPTDIDTNTHLLPPTFNVILFSLHSVLSMAGVLLNVTAMRRASNLQDCTASLLYRALCSADLLASIASGLHALLFFLFIVSPTSTWTLGPAFLAYVSSVMAVRIAAVVTCVFAVLSAVPGVSHRVTRYTLACTILLTILIWIGIFASELLILIQSLSSDSSDSSSPLPLEDFMNYVFYHPNSAHFLYFFSYDSQQKSELPCILGVLYTGVPILLPAAVALSALAVMVLRRCHTDEKKEVGGGLTAALITLLFVFASPFSLEQLLFSDCSAYTGLHARGVTLGVRNVVGYCTGYLPFFFKGLLDPMLVLLGGFRARAGMETSKGHTERAVGHPSYL